MINTIILIDGLLQLSFSAFYSTKSQKPQLQFLTYEALFLYPSAQCPLAYFFILYLILVLVLWFAAEQKLAAIIAHLTFGFGLVFFNEWCEDQDVDAEPSSGIESIGLALLYVVATLVGPITIIIFEHCSVANSKTSGTSRKD
jgi:hypothetical protein